MIFGLVTFTQIKLHLPSYRIRSATLRALTHLNFVGEVAKLGGGMWLWGADQLVLWKASSTISYLTHDHFRDMTQVDIGIELGFHWQMTHVEFASDVVCLHNIEA